MFPLTGTQGSANVERALAGSDQFEILLSSRTSRHLFIIARLGEKVEFARF